MTLHAYLSRMLGLVLALSAALAAAVGVTSELAAQVPAPAASGNGTPAGPVSNSSAPIAKPAAPGSSRPGSAAALPVAAPPGGAAIGSAHSPQVAAAARTPLPPGQVWQCVIEGERIFSDAPCGAHASIRQLKELNVMDSLQTQSAQYPYNYFPMSTPPPAFAPAPGFAAAPAEDSDYGDYSGPDLLWVHGYRRNYFSHQDNHLRPQSHPHPRRN
jgi:hypothetical protein